MPKKKRTIPTAASESPLVGAERRKRAFEQFKQVYYSLPEHKRTLPLLSLKTGIGFRLIKEEYLPMLEAEEEEAEEVERNETATKHALPTPEQLEAEQNVRVL